MEFGHDGSTLAREAVDDLRLPQRAPAIEGPRDEPRDLLG
jgi:hypothetical protein